MSKEGLVEAVRDSASEGGADLGLRLKTTSVFIAIGQAVGSCIERRNLVLPPKAYSNCMSFSIIPPWRAK